MSCSQLNAAPAAQGVDPEAAVRSNQHTESPRGEDAAMELRYLGRSGIRISALTLGAMSFGSMGNADPDDCARIVHRALDGGINAIDTADVYSGGESERIVGAATKDRRDDVVLATKCFNPMSR